MLEMLADRTRSMLATSVDGLRRRALGGLSVLALMARHRLAELDRREAAARVPEPVQRFGARLWQRAVERFPALAHLTEAQPGPASVHEPFERVVAAEPDPPADAREGDPALSTLLGDLRSPSAEAAAAAALSLRDRPEPSARTALLEVLDNPEGYFNPLTRVAALRAIAETLPRPPSADELEPIVSRVRDLDAEVSMAAIDAVATRAPGSTAIEHLLPIVLDQSGYFLPVVRDAASRALERAGLMQTTAE